MGDLDFKSIDTELPVPASADSSVIDETHSCVVCLSDPEDARLCKQCAHLFCRDCLETTYRTLRRCPHCRGAFPLNAYVRVPWISDLLKNVNGLAPKIANECTMHPQKLLVDFCNDCERSCCATCWMEQHAGHEVVPIEKAHGIKRGEIQTALDRLGNHAEGLAEFRRKYGSGFEARYDVVKKEGDAYKEECIRQITGTWSEMEKMRCPLKVVDKSLTRASAVAAWIKSVAQDPHLDRLVDDFKSLQMEAEEVVEEKEVIDVVDFYASVHRRDALQYFSPWLPDWVVNEPVMVKNCMSFLSFNNRPCVDQFIVCGITWRIWITDRGYQVAAKDREEKLHVYVTMAGRQRLKNYALRIEKVPNDDQTLVADLSVRCEIVRRDTFYEGEQMFFPLESYRDWISQDGDLAIVFKVRPLDYRQKCIDQEIYFRSLMESKSSKDGGAEDDHVG